MWFGDLVTPPWWDDLWLKEAFASWGTMVSLGTLYPDDGYQIDAISDNIDAMRLDSLSSARAVREPITRSDDIRSAYDSITYDKGQAVIGMVDSYFGAEQFRAALGRYVETFEDGVADSSNFFDIIGRETKEPDLNTAFRSFVEQSGLPLISAQMTCDPGVGAEVALTQSRYSPLGSRIEQDRQWTIPFCAVTASADGEQTRTCQMMRDKRMTMSLPLDEDGACPAWMLPNAGGKGYWRYDLDLLGWRLLADQFGALKPGEALTAVDSAMASFEAGRIDIGSLMAIIEAGSRRDDRRIVGAAAGALGDLAKLVREDAEAREIARQEMIRIFGPRLDMVDLESTSLEPDAEPAEESEDTRILRSMLERYLAREANEPELRASFVSAAGAFVGMAGMRSDRVLNSDDFSTAFAIAVQDLGEPFIDALMAQRNEIDDPVFALAIAYALGENRDPALSERVLNIALSGELGPRESYTIVNGQMREPQVEAVAWDWLQLNFQQFVTVIPAQRKLSTPGLASSFCYPGAVDELELMFDRMGRLAPGYERALSESVERIELCVALQDEKSDEVIAFFKQR